MRTINVKLKGYFNKSYNGVYGSVSKGKLAIIDRLLITPAANSGVMMRVINVWKEPRYFDSEWFGFKRN